MRNTLVIGVMGVLLCCGGLAQAAGVDIYSNWTIQNGDDYTKPPYDYIALYDSAIVTMTGGNVGCGIVAYDTSTFNLQGGYVGLSPFDFYGSSIANVTGGTATGFLMHDNSVLNISGGVVHGASMDNSTILNLSGGDLRGYFYVHNIVNIYARNLSVVPYYVSDSLASGHWADGTSFQFVLGRARGYDPPTQIVFHEIPEPAIMFLLGFGMMLARKKLSK
jgi:hypothetical protein